MNYNFTPRLDKVVTKGKKEAVRLGNDCLDAEHVVLALLETDSGTAITTLKKTGVEFTKIREEIYKEITPKEADKKTLPESAIKYSKNLESIFGESKKVAESFNNNYIGTEHFLIATLENVDSVVTKVFKSLGIDTSGLSSSLKEELGSKASAAPSKIPAGSSTRADKSTKDSALKAYAIELVERATKGEIDAVVGREEEIKRVCKILSRKKKNNPVIVGPAGVGKTAIVEGLALRISQKKVPAVLQDRKIYSLDLSLMIAGTVYRGQFEERLKKVMEEVKANPNFIVFIDEIHTVIGAGSAEGTMDACNILKPALARGEFKCIGATTQDEYRKYIERDSALERRFQPVKAGEPNAVDTIEILKGARKTYEDFHGVHYPDEVIESIVTLTNRYVLDRFQPDKSFDIMDEIGADIKLSFVRDPVQKEELEKQILVTRKTKADAVALNDFDTAKEIKKQEDSLVHKLNKLVTLESSECLTAKLEDVYKIVNAWTGIPVGALSGVEKQKFINVNESLESVVVGQKEAVDLVSLVIKKSRTSLKDPNRPIGGFLFVGPTGVGKTLLGTTIAKEVFGSTKSMLKLDMSEYMDGIAANKLIGSAPGYVGYSEGGLLTKYVQRNPYSLILFDEVEKAHPDVLQLLLQILEDGKLTDSHGKIVDFKNTIVICTSNVGVQDAKSMGFGSQGAVNQRSKDNLLGEVKRVFKPEFLNRLRVAVFNPLGSDEARKVVTLEIDRVNSRLRNEGVEIKCSEQAIEYIIKHGFDEKYGARNVRTQVEELIENSLIDEFLTDKVSKNSVITFDVVEDKLTHKIER